MDPRRTIAPAAAGALMLALLASGAAAQPATAPMMTMPLAQQASEAGGVRFAIEPLHVEPDAKVWSFRVSLRTASGAPREDLLRTAFLLDRAAGTQQAPWAWKPDAASGGRTGTLTFRPVRPQPAAIELRIQRTGEKAPRVFRWDLDCPCNNHASHAATGRS